MNPIILIHGGAWDIPDDFVDAHKKGVTQAALSGRRLLNHSALDAVEAAISSMEDDPTFDAGTGSFLNRLGMIELDAAIIEGTSMRAGAVGAIHRIRNPIKLARKVMEECDTIFVVGEGAEQFASDKGMSLCDNQDLVIEREKERWNILSKEKKPAEDFFKHGTVGAVAVDAEKRVVAGTSTGGTPFKQPGRIGDSPILGAGTYATETCAVSCTGWGEAIMKAGMAKKVADFIDEGESPQDAAEKSVDILRKRFSGYGGVIVVTIEGDYGIAYNTPRMARCVYTAEMDVPIAEV
ncbi:MAG: isoaspartyl peptidase/L-asparaginase [Theionarchaea archaeon]|nr:isoaspartyl peptidase/L-asparaginase [Theionarchaea archaeon]